MNASRSSQPLRPSFLIPLACRSACPVPPALVAQAQADRHRGQARSSSLLLLLIVAAAFRFWQIGAIPPGLFGDEAVNGLDALDVLAGRGQVFFPANYGREGLHMFLVAFSFLLFGVNEFALRFPSIVAGLVTVPLTYWLGKELLRRTPLENTPVPLLAAAFLATSFWHVHFSRFGVRGAFTPLMITLAFWAFWRGINRRDARWLAGAGVALGVNLYFYTAARLVPIFLTIYLVAEWWINRRTLSGTSSNRSPILRSHFLGIVALYALAAVVFAPLLLYFLQHPGTFTARVGEVFVGNPQVSAGNPFVKSFLALFASVLQFFVAGLGDRDWFYNLPGRPVFDVATGALAIIGALVLIRNWRNRRYLFLLLWWPVMLIPTFLAVDRIPALPRALGVLPGLYFFPAVGVWQVVEWVRARVGPRDRRRAITLALAGPLILHATANWWGYFETWGRSAGAFDAFDGDVVAAAHWLQDHQPDRLAYISADIYRHPSFVLLYERVPLTEFFDRRNPSLRWFDGRQALLMPPPQGAIYLLGNSAMPDRQRLQRLLPVMTPLTIVALSSIFDHTSRGPGLEVYQVDKGGPPARTQGLPGQGLPRLVGYNLVGEARPGGVIEATLYWTMSDPGDGPAVEAPPLRVAVEDAAGIERGAWAGALPYRYGEWHVGDVVVTWHQVTISQDAPPGLYAVRVAMGVPGSPATRLAPGGPAPDFMPPGVIPAEFSGGLQMLDIQTRPAVGDRARMIIDLVWRLTQPTETSPALGSPGYTLFVHLLNASNEMVAQADTIPASGLFPTDFWPLGVPVRDQVEIALPPGAPAGRYTIALGWYDWRTGERLSVLDIAGQPLTDRIELSVEMKP